MTITDAHMPSIRCYLVHICIARALISDLGGRS